MPKTIQVQPLSIAGIQYAEGLRWNNGELWFSDIFARKVYTLDGDTLVTKAILDDDEPSGLGFLPNGDAIVVAMQTRQLRTIVDGRTELYATLSPPSTSECNDMMIDAHGRAYVSTFGFDLRSGEEAKPGELVLVRPGEDAVVAADGLVFPNGIVLSPDGKTLVVSELFAEKITAFDVAADGSLSGRRTFATVPGTSPDGLAIDAEGGVWVSTSTGGKFLRILDGGEVTHEVSLGDEWAVSCALGGEDGRTLFMATAVTTTEEWIAGKATSNIRTATVDIPAA